MMKIQNTQSVLTDQQRLVLDYWVSLHNDDALPTRRQINPVRLGKSLASTSLVQKSDGAFKYRLTGSRVHGLFGSQQDKSLLEVIDETIAEAGSASLELALESGKPVSGSRKVGARWHCWLRLPFLDEDGAPNLVLCIDEFPTHIAPQVDAPMTERFVA